MSPDSVQVYEGDGIDRDEIKRIIDDPTELWLEVLRERRLKDTKITFAP